MHGVVKIIEFHHSFITVSHERDEEEKLEMNDLENSCGKNNCVSNGVVPSTLMFNISLSLGFGNKYRNPNDIMLGN